MGDPLHGLRGEGGDGRAGGGGGPQAEGGSDLLHDRGLLDAGENPHGACPPRADEGIDLGELRDQASASAAERCAQARFAAEAEPSQNWEFPRLWPMRWELHRLCADYQIIHELLRISAPPEAVEAVKEVMARRARWPLAAKQVLDWGLALESEGRVGEACAAYRRGRLFFPMNSNCARAPNTKDPSC